MADRFELETQIMSCWNIIEDIKTLTEEVIEAPEFDRDKMSNVLIGLEALYQIRFNKLFREFEQMIAAGKIT